MARLKATLELEYEANPEDYGTDNVSEMIAVDIANDTIAALDQFLYCADDVKHSIVEVIPAYNPPVPHADIAELRALGIIQEVNRLVLHPLGLALEVTRDAAGEHISGIWDYRSDPEGIIFGEGYSSPEKATEVADMIEAKGRTRGAALGYIVQPFAPEHKQLTVRVLEQTIDRGPWMAAVGEYDEGESQPTPGIDAKREIEMRAAAIASWQPSEDVKRERDLDEGASDEDYCCGQGCCHEEAA